MNANALKEYMNKLEVTPVELAGELKMNVSTWYRKIGRAGDNFTVKEMNEIISFLKMPRDNAAKIFFDERLADMRDEAEGEQEMYFPYGKGQFISEKDMEEKVENIISHLYGEYESFSVNSY